MSYSFELGISGITCSGCSKNIELALEKYSFIKKLSINLIFNKLFIVIEEEEYISTVISTIQELKFTVTYTKQFNLIKEQRTLKIISDQGETIKKNLLNILGIVSIKDDSSSKKEREDKLIIITYKPKLIKSYEILDLMDKILINYTLYDDLYNKIKDTEQNINSFKVKEFVFCLILTFMILTITIFISGTNWELILCKTYLFSMKLNLEIVITMILSLFIIIKYGIEIYKKAYISFKITLSAGMEVLISVGSISAIVLATIFILKLINSTEESQIMENSINFANSIGTSALVVSISAIGKFVEDQAKNYIKNQSSKLVFSNEVDFNNIKYSWVQLKNKKFTIINERKLAPALFETEDLAMIRVGEIILLDCMLIEGEIEINEKINMGYDIISKILPGDKIRSGSILSKSNGQCIVSVECVIEESKFFKLTETMIDSMNQKLKFQHFIDKIAAYFVPTILIISIFTILIWTINKILYNDSITWLYIFERAISVQVVSCPCAFGLAIPTVTTIILSQALKCGILIKNLTILPEIRNTQKIVFDKTGTLTEVIKDIKVEYSNNDYPYLSVTELLEASSKHPIGQALYNYSLIQKRLVSSDRNYENSITIRGESLKVNSNGVSCKINLNGEEGCAYIGNIDYYTQNKIAIDNMVELEEMIKFINSKDLSCAIVCFDSTVIALYSIDTKNNMRLESEGVIKHLKENYNIESFILSGDNNELVKSSGEALGISKDCSFGGKNPEEKRKILKDLKNNDLFKVMMVGDGINDVLSLSEASFGVSFNPNSQLNLISSDFVIIKEDLSLIISLIEISNYTYYFIWINLFWAFAYNILMIPMATGLFSNYIDIEISPQLSSFLMLLSDLLIIFNSNLLRFVKFDSFKNKFSLQTKNERKFESKGFEVSSKELNYNSTSSSSLDEKDKADLLGDKNLNSIIEIQ